MRSLLSATVAVCLLAACSKSERTTEDGVYTTEQAERGKAIHTQACYQCHAQGYYKGRRLLDTWTGRTMGELNTYLNNTMPEDRPASLMPEEYADVMAYLLSTFDFPVGPEELPPDQQVLDQIIIRKTVE